MPRVWARISDEAGTTTEEKRWSEVSDLQTMRAVIEHIIDNDISNMEETFVYCGYMELIISILCDGNANIISYENNTKLYYIDRDNSKKI